MEVRFSAAYSSCMLKKALFGKKIVPMMMLTAVVSGCVSFEYTDDDSAADGGTGGPQGVGDEQPGVQLDCGFLVGNYLGPVETGVGFPSPNTMCVDPSSVQIDTNGDGELELDEMLAACSRKCPDAPDGYPFFGPGFSASWDDFVAFGVEGPYDSCSAVQARVDVAAGACNPSSPGHTAPWPTTLVPPTHEGTFTSEQPDSSASIDVNGDVKAIEFAGEIAFSVYDCEERGRQEVCMMDLQQLSLTLGSSPVFGDYLVDFAALTLNRPSTTTVSFACDHVGCSGSFDFIERTGTLLGADLNFEQTNTITSAPGGGHVTLGTGGMGGFARVTGELELDSGKHAGTLRLRGTGRDAAGGAFASTTFDLTTAVGRSRF